MAEQGRVPARLPHSSAPLLLPLQVRKHGAKLLASMVNGMDDKDDPHNLVALEAMSSLSKLLDHLEERDIQSMLLHIAIRIRPFFDSVREPGDRACALVLSKAAHPMSQGTRGRWVSLGWAAGSRLCSVGAGGQEGARSLQGSAPQYFAALSGLCAFPKPLQRHLQFHHCTERSERWILPPAAPVPSVGSTPAPAAPCCLWGVPWLSPARAKPQPGVTQPLSQLCAPQAGRAGPGTETPIPEPSVPLRSPFFGTPLQAVVGIGDVEAGRCAAREGLNSPQILLAPRLQEQPELRQSSIVLFGNLTKFSEEDCEAFFEQILNGLVTLLLHLQDPKPEVVKVSSPLPTTGTREPPQRGVPAWGGHEALSPLAHAAASPSLCHRPASLLCACVAPTWAARGSATCS